jgi:nitric oxide reductase NorD protein
MSGPLTSAEIEERLDEFLDPVLSSRRTASEPARLLADFDRAMQEFVLRWTGIIASSNAEMAYQFASHVPRALGLMDEAGIEAWIIYFMDVYDKTGLYPAAQALQELDAYTQALNQKATGLPLEEVQGILETFVRGLNGRAMKIEAGQDIYTDTETLYLPGMLSRFAARADNFRLYKAMVAHQWAQTWFGTWRLNLGEAATKFADPVRAIRLFHSLETVRLDACIARELPGMYRDMCALRQAHVQPLTPDNWTDLATRLQTSGATVQDSLDCLHKVYSDPAPDPICYQGVLLPERVEQAMALRRERDKNAFRTALAKLAEERKPAPEREEATTETAEEPGFTAQSLPDPDMPEGFTFELLLDGQPITPPDDVQSVMDSIIQDLGEIPDDYLVAAGDGGYHMESDAKTERDPTDVWKGTYHEDGAFLYNEWDHERQHYRKNWCVLRELDVHPQAPEFVAHTLSKYSGLVKVLRRTFEALRGEDKLLKKQPYGDDVDIDALVEAYADNASGLEMSERLFTKLHKLERNIAVMFMVDMSGSTKGWINEAEREALVLLAESLETLGDRYAIYGFSGMTRKRCELYRIKRFDEPYTDMVRARISGITPQDYTRMGVTIRHLSKLLNGVDARTKLLITLSDGKPDDYDGYRGTYGIEDTRKALIEAKRDGIHPFCITIDTEAREYLPHMYGAVNYVLVDDVRKLPLKVSDIYRRLTS